MPSLPLPISPPHSLITKVHTQYRDTNSSLTKLSPHKSTPAMSLPNFAFPFPFPFPSPFPFPCNMSAVITRMTNTIRLPPIFEHSTSVEESDLRQVRWSINPAYHRPANPHRSLARAQTSLPHPAASRSLPRSLAADRPDSKHREQTPSNMKRSHKLRNGKLCLKTTPVLRPTSARASSPGVLLRENTNGHGDVETWESGANVAAPHPEVGRSGKTPIGFTWEESWGLGEEVEWKGQRAGNSEVRERIHKMRRGRKWRVGRGSWRVRRKEVEKERREGKGKVVRWLDLVEGDYAVSEMVVKKVEGEGRVREKIEEMGEEKQRLEKEGEKEEIVSVKPIWPVQRSVKWAVEMWQRKMEVGME